MNRCVVLFALLFAFAGFPIAAMGGAGGLEFNQVLGQNLWPLPGKSGLIPSTGQISSIAGMGYGVDDDGSVMGGFLMGISSKNLYVLDSPLGKPLDGFNAGYIGTIQGWQTTWGPLVGLFTTRIGFGGADWASAGSHTAGFSVLGTIGAELGIMVFPWFTVGLEVGGAGTITFVTGEPFLIGAAPTVGMRFLWGSFQDGKRWDK